MAIFSNSGINQLLGIALAKIPGAKRFFELHGLKWNLWCVVVFMVVHLSVYLYVLALVFHFSYALCGVLCDALKNICSIKNYILKLFNCSSHVAVAHVSLKNTAVYCMTQGVKGERG